MDAQIRSQPLIAGTRCDYARTLLARGQPRDNDQALELLQQALATAERHELKALATGREH